MKAVFGMLMLLVVGTECARIKRHRASGAATTQAEMEDFVTIIKSEEGEHVDDRREKGEWIFGSSNEEAQVAANNNTELIKEIVHAAAWAINKSLQAKAIIPKWNNLKLALNETKLATEKSADAVVRLKEKLLQAIVLFTSSGLQNISQALKDGMSNSSLSTLLAHASEKNGAEDFQKALEVFKSTAIELSEIASSAETVLEVMKKAREIMDEVVQITDADALLVGEMQAINELQAQVQVGFETVRGLADKVVEHSDDIKPMWDNMINGVKQHADNATIAMTADARETLVQFADEVQMLKELFTTVIEPFVPELIDAVRTVTDAVNAHALSPEAPEHVAEEEMGRWSGCAWRSIRWFDDISDVDIDSTMTCEMEWFGRYRCQCIALNDCYATEFWRPEPKEVKRCFKQVGFSFR